MKKIIATVSVFLLLLASKLYSQSPGSLDLSFDSDGKVVTPIGTGDDYGGSMVIQPDGKIIVAGSATNASDDDFAVARYNTDGSLDISFDGDGMVTTGFGGSNDQIFSIALQLDGKIVVVGAYDNGTDHDFALARYNNDGSLDISFDGDGKLTTDFYLMDEASSVVIQPDGKIIAAGASGNSLGDFTLARYNTDGGLDSTFDGDGKLNTDFGGNMDIAYSMVLQPDGKIIVAGGAGYFAPVATFGLARYNTDGSLDNTFDGDGILTTNFVGSNGDVCYSVTLQPDGKIIAAGISYNVGGDFALVRYNSDGSLDNTFDSDGKLTTDFGGGMCKSVKVQSDGKIIAAGYYGNVGSASSNFALACYNSNGSLDNTFDSDGILTTDFAGLEDIGNALAIQGDGKIVVAGYTFNGTNYDFALARYFSTLNLGLLDFSLNNSVFIYPNPITQEAKLEYALSNNETVSITLMDISGQLVKTFLANEQQQPGNHSQTLVFPEGLASGSYFLVISTPCGKVSLKIVK